MGLRLFSAGRTPQLEDMHDGTSSSNNVSPTAHHISITIQAMKAKRVAQEKRKKKMRVVHARPKSKRWAPLLKGNKAGSSGGGSRTIVIANSAGAGSTAAFLANILRAKNSAEVQFYNWCVQGLLYRPVQRGCFFLSDCLDGR